MPSARDKAANNLEEHEKTLYYERMAFVIEIPTIGSEIDGNPYESNHWRGESI
ncbi:MAG TPA: DUF3871 family protein [Chitinophagaceae bacterium]|nr:DUF3871 family protein [Chitinophagaceae bacterium]